MTTVADVLQECCEQAGVTFKPVRKSHGDCKQIVYGNGGPGGICCALSLLWLSRYFKGNMDNDQFGGDSFGDLVSALNDKPGLVQNVANFFGSLLSNAPPEKTKGEKLAGQLKVMQDKEVARGAAISRARAVLDDDSLGEDERIDHFDNVTKLVGYKALYRDSMASLGVRNISFINDFSTKTNFYSLKDATRPYNTASSFMTGQSGASLIKFATHYQAIISDTGRPKYKFLDVNGGQAITTDVAKFKSFLAAFFAGPVIDEYTKSHSTMQVTMARLTTGK